MNIKSFTKLLLSALLLAGGLSLSAQNKPVVNDYASSPYWIDMMQDPNANFFETQKAFYTYWQGRSTHRGDGYKPFKRWEYYWQTRVNPDGTFPEPGSVYREYNRYIQDHAVTAGLKTGQAVWKELGPTTRTDFGGYNGVGRVNAIAFHPTDTATIYVGAPKGGLWITRDGGSTWSSPTDNLPTLGVSAILIDPTNPDHILIGTGDRDGGNSAGLGVFRSDDGGLNWIPFNNGMGDVTVGMLARPESNIRMILAATNSGIYKSLDAGENWTKTSPDNSEFKDIQFRPGSSTIAYAASNRGFYRTDNGGDTWTLVPAATGGYPDGGRLVIGVTPANDSLVYLVSGASKYQGCFLSRNFGESFTEQSTTPNILGYAYDGSDDKSQAWYDLMIHVDPVNPQLVFVGGINIWKSTDGGKKWQITSHWWGDRTNEVHADQHAFGYNPANQRLYAGNDGGIYFTVNQGNTWKEISEGLGIGQLYKIGISNTDSKKMTGGFQDNGSATWTGTNWANTGGGDGMECAVDPFDARYSYTTLYYGPVERWFNSAGARNIAGKGTNGITEEGAWVTPFLISENDGNTMLIGYKNIWMSRNIKATGPVYWTKISDNLAGKNDVNLSVLEQSPADVNIVYAARNDDGKLFRSDNVFTPPVTWTDISNRLPSGGALSDIECHPYDPYTVYMAKNRKIYKSTNKGGTWTDISGNLPSISINSIAFDKSSNEGLYIGTDAGTYYRDANMTDWVLYGQSFPVSVGVSELEVYHDLRNRADSRLRAATFGRGVWEIPLAETSQILSPALLTATTTDSDVELSWVAPFYEQNITGYRVYRNGAPVTTINGTSYTDSQIEPDVTYTYTVSALYNGNIESGLSNEVIATIVSPIELPYLQTFERSTGGFSAKFTLEGWKYGNSETLKVPDREGNFFAASSVAAGEGVQVKDYLVTPEIDLSSFTNRTITLKFAYTMRKYRTYDKFSVFFRTSPDSSWVKLEDMNPPSKVTWLWDTTQINLPDRALSEKAQIGFYYDNSNQYAYGAAVDDIELFLNTTSARPIDNQAAFKAYPNPSQGRFQVELMTTEPGDARLQVTNIAGQVVFEKIISNQTGTLSEMIDISGQPKGVYQLTVRTHSSEWRQKITIQ
jgi:photosystem II stability/assembly factor-like uncharacterized protein